MNFIRKLWCLGLLCLAPAAGAAGLQDLLWLSDVAPRRTAMEKTAHPAGMAGHDGMDAAIGGEEDIGLMGGAKRLWVRQGADPAAARYLAADEFPADVRLVDAYGKRSSQPLAQTGERMQARFQLEELGFRNAYLERRTLEDGVLRVQLAKAELLKGSCCVKERDMVPAQAVAISDPGQPLELVREHEEDERLFTRLVSGDRITFVVKRFGKLQAGVPVTMLTQSGWQKQAVSDRDGRAEFTLIRDYFPSWADFRRSNKGSFVVAAEWEEAAAGALGGRPYSRVHYQATLSGRYALSPYDYKSYAWGVGGVLFVVVFGGLGVYLYRRRRTQPFREIRLAEPA